MKSRLRQVKAVAFRRICAVIVGLGLAGCGGSGGDAGDTRRSTNEGSTLVFASDRDNPPPEDEDLFQGIVRLELYTIDSGGGGAPERLTKNKTIDLNPACSPDDTTIAFTSARGGAASIYLMKLGGDEPRRLTASHANEFHPSWSPDGKEIVVAREGSNGDSHLYVVTVDDGDGRRLVSGRGDDAWPAWSPRGDRIAFLRAPDPQDPSPDLYVTSVTGTGTERLLRKVDSGRLTWSPEGDELAFGRTVEGSSSIWVIDVETRQLRKLTRAHLENPQSSPAWSPDGRLIAFAETAGIAFVHPDGSNYQQLRLEPTLFMIGGESRGWVTYTDPAWCGLVPG